VEEAPAKKQLHEHRNKQEKLPYKKKSRGRLGFCKNQWKKTSGSKKQQGMGRSLLEGFELE